MTQLSLHFFGFPRLEVDANTIEVKSQKGLALVAYLAAAGQAQGRDTIAALLWPEHNQERARANLRSTLYSLNRTPLAAWLVADEARLLLQPSALAQIDIAQFEHALAAGGISDLHLAADLYTDDFLAGFHLPDSAPFEEWTARQQDYYRRAMLAALAILVEHALTAGDYAEAEELVQRQLRLDNLSEEAWRQWMRVLVRSGRRNQALVAYLRCCQVLYDELGVPPSPETMALHEEILREEAEIDGRQVTPGVHRHNLPTPTTRFIGREQELADIARLFRAVENRLVTILGPGGMGKTRLALEFARTRVTEYLDGIYFIPLASVNHAGQVVSAIGEALGIQHQSDGRSPERQLFDYLRTRQIMLVLDNFEHLAKAVLLVQQLLESCPELRLLVTTRERLQLSGETTLILDSLAFPAGNPTETALEYSAVQLFLQAARSTRPSYVPEPDDWQYITRICRLVSGVPLAIILAATWIEVLSVRDIGEELAKGYDFLATELRDLPERQRSMRTVLDYSWQRLSEVERSVFTRLSMFEGGFTREAALAVAGATLRTLGHLVRKSFVQRSDSERYAIHELLRQYGQTQLRLTGVLEDVCAGHAAYFLDFLSQRSNRLGDHRQLTALAELRTESENIQSAWRWAVQTHDHTALDGALEGLFRWNWTVRSRQQECQALLRYALHCWTPLSGHSPHRVWRRILARVMEHHGPWLTSSRTKERIERALALAFEQGDDAEVPFCRWALGLAVISERRGPGSDEESEEAVDQLAAQFYELSLQDYRNLGDRFYIAQVLESLGQCYRLQWQVDRALPYLRESLAMRHEVRDKYGMARSLRELGWAAYIGGIGPEAERTWREAQNIRLEIDDRQGVVDSIFTLSLLEITRGNWRTATRLAKQAWRAADQINNTFYPVWCGRVLEIADIMEKSTPEARSASPLASGELTAFKAALLHRFFSRKFEAHAKSFRMMLELASSEEELAVCLPFVAGVLAAAGSKRRAIQLLALAFRYPAVAHSWLGNWPQIDRLRQELKSSLAPAEYDEAWAEGQALMIQTTVRELRTLLSAGRF